MDQEIIHFTSDRYLGCFQFFAMISTLQIFLKMSLSVHEQAFLPVWWLSGVYNWEQNRSGTAGSYSWRIFNFTRMLLDCTSGYTNFYPINTICTQFHIIVLYESISYNPYKSFHYPASF